MSLSEEVKELVHARRYDEALTLLATVEHPKAREWESRIRLRMHQSKPLLSTQRPTRATWVLVLVVGVVAVTAAGLAFMTWQSNQDAQRERDLTEAEISLLLDCNVAYSMQSNQYCGEYARRMSTDYPGTLLECAAESDRYGGDMFDCMTELVGE